MLNFLTHNLEFKLISSDNQQFHDSFLINKKVESTMLFLKTVYNILIAGKCYNKKSMGT